MKKVPPPAAKQPAGLDRETEKTSGSTEKSAANSVASGAERKKRITMDTGKLVALRNAGWSMKKIAEELGISEGSVFNYLKKMEGKNEE